ncbi:MAG TPA: transglutaminaseTgpA domain-containing protein [Acidimicrobiales bacterium]|nr:transglutaminaseTgpA domain-containing protein [Acidimicrobiales bacterium]
MSRTVRPLLPFAEGALVVLSLAVVLSFARLFNDGSFFPKLAAFALVAHGTAIVARRLGWSLPASAALSLLALGITIGLALYPDTTILGLPTADTLSAARADFADVWTQFQSVQAPTDVTTAFLLAAGLALWWSAFVADWAAFRVWVPFESVIPAGTVFVFASLFAAKQSQVALTGLFVLASMAFLLIHRVTRQQTNAGWVTSDVQRGTNSLLRVGGVLALLSVLAAMLIGPNLPQAHSAAIVTWRGNGGGPNSRTTVSPLVDIGHRLVDQSNSELFRVKSNVRSYWRMTALDEFDGQIWKSDGSYESADGRLPKGVSSSAPNELATQSYDIIALDTIWLPAAFVPRSIDDQSTDVRYEPGTSTLIVGTSVTNANTAKYTVQSELPVFDPAQLETAPPEIPDDIRSKDMQLPNDFSPRVAAEAQRAIGSATTVYDKALALQNYFRDNFTYDLNVGPGHGESAIERFLFDTKRGYCEQFAGTYAAMARSLGIPARVAVGFTPGDQDSQDPTVYHVKGLHAHAWPEVYIGGQGWVLFEPTPTRGAPNAQQYTHVAEEQAADSGGESTTLVPTSAAPTASTTNPLATATTKPFDEVNAGTGLTGKHEPSFWSTSRFGGRALLVLAILPLLALLYAAGVLAWHALYRARRRRAAVNSDEQVRLAWQESVEALGLLGVTPSRAETPLEFGARASGAAGVDGFAELAGLLVRSSYSADGAGDEDAERASELREHVTSSVRERSARSARVRSALDPRPPSRRRPRSTHGPASRKRGDAPLIEILEL